MFHSTYRLLKFFSVAGEIIGRKKLQKMIHLLSAHGEEFRYPYEYHYYGPYSASLQEEINALVEQDLLAERHEEETYLYSLTGKGIAFKKSLEEEGGYHFPLDEKLVGELNGESATFLEMVSTYAYLLDSGYGEEQAKKRAEELKPHLIGHLEEAVRFYHEKIKPSASRG